MRDISLHSNTLRDFHEKNLCPDELLRLLPPRRAWVRLGISDRKRYKSSTEISIESLKRTVLSEHYRVREGKSPSGWYLRLESFIQDVHKRIGDANEIFIEKPTIIALKKENSRQCRKFRPISEYPLTDRVIISITAKYLTQIFDRQLLDCAYAFRAVSKSNVRTHHETIDAILAFKKRHQNRKMYVAECDIKKFYDCVNHNLIKDIFSGFVYRARQYENKYDDRATSIFLKYLDSYSFNLDVYPLNGTDHFSKLGCPNGEFEWPEGELKSEFYGEQISELKLGVPQGGALSCLISNLLLHNVDEVVLGNKGVFDIEYLRYCDDMILLADRRETCEDVLYKYTEALRRNLLLVHNPREIGKYGKTFFNVSKSKKPFLWNANSVCEPYSPWISFVGYQVRFDGVIRVRKKSIEKEINKQEREATRVLKAINYKEIKDINTNSRKSLKQQLLALECRLIAMSVGRHQLHNYKSITPTMCWANGFRKLLGHSTARSQLKLLDSKRNRQIFRVKTILANLVKESDNPDVCELPTRYRGAPFSYYGVFTKTTRNGKR